MCIEPGSLARTITGKPDAETVLRIAAEGFGVTEEELLAHCRKRPLPMYRQATWLAIRELTDESFPKIARMFDRDHTTVLHGIRASRLKPRAVAAAERLKTAVRQQCGIDPSQVSVEERLRGEALMAASIAARRFPYDYPAAVRYLRALVSEEGAD